MNQLFWKHFLWTSHGNKAVLVLSGFLRDYRISVQENIPGFIFRSYLLNLFGHECMIGGYTLNLTFERNNQEIRRMSSNFLLEVDYFITLFWSDISLIILSQKFRVLSKNCCFTNHTQSRKNSNFHSWMDWRIILQCFYTLRIL